MMELTLSSVSHTKMKLQFHVLIYTLSIVTEEKSEFPGHDAFHPEFCKALFFPNSTAGCKCVYLCLIACFHARLSFDMQDPSHVVISMLFWALLKNRFMWATGLVCETLRRLWGSSVPLEVHHSGYAPAAIKYPQPRKALHECADC